jgi:hypothetical protein
VGWENHKSKSTSFMPRYVLNEQNSKQTIYAVAPKRLPNNIRALFYKIIKILLHIAYLKMFYFSNESLNYLARDVDVIDIKITERTIICNFIIPHYLLWFKSKHSL